MFTLSHDHSKNSVNNNIDADVMLRDAGLRRTNGRVAILEALSHAQRPLSKDEIVTMLGERRLNKTTIYRALDGFEQAGLVHRAYLEGRMGYYELAHQCTKQQCHPHFTCEHCGTTHCLTKANVPLVTGLAEGFVLHRQQVRLQGLCPRCSKGQ